MGCASFNLLTLA